MLVELGERYAALGLPAAARGAFERALAGSAADDASAARRLAELALSTGHSDRARLAAIDALQRAPGPTARLLLGRAALAAGEPSAARREFAMVLENPTLPASLRARAHLGASAVAKGSGDGAGASAHALAAWDVLLEWTRQASPSNPADSDVLLFEEAAAQLARLGCGREASERLEECSPAVEWRSLLCALVLVARAAHGEAVSSRRLEEVLAEAVAHRPTLLPLRLALLEHTLRRNRRIVERRELESLAAPTCGWRASSLRGLTRLHLMLGKVHAPGEAEEHYRQAALLQPGNADAMSCLAESRLARGELTGAVGAIEQALRIDSAHRLAWRCAARILVADAEGAAATSERLLAAAGDDLGSATACLVEAVAEQVREDCALGMSASGHRLKNSLGILGARARAARKLAQGAAAERLSELERGCAELHAEWSATLRTVSRRPTPAVLERLSLAVLLEDVTSAARASTTVPIAVQVAAEVPLVRGERSQLREALLNIVCNAVQACEGGVGRVVVTVRMMPARVAPVVVIDVDDSGPGIARGALGRVLAPGYTTKPSGSGVGLPIADRIIAMHHGRLVLVSEPGRGTRVSIVLPTEMADSGSSAMWAETGD